MKRKRRGLSIVILASVLSCRAPDAAPVPPSTDSAATKESSPTPTADPDDDAPLRLRSVEDAEACLLAARFFVTANPSLGTWPPRRVAAFNTILDSPRAAESIERLLAAPDPAPRLYGACGLYYVAPERYLPELEKQRALGGTIDVQDGCVLELGIPVADAVDQIRDRDLALRLRLPKPSDEVRSSHIH